MQFALLARVDLRAVPASTHLHLLKSWKDQVQGERWALPCVDKGMRERKNFLFKSYFQENSIKRPMQPNEKPWILLGVQGMSLKPPVFQATYTKEAPAASPNRTCAHLLQRAEVGPVLLCSSCYGVAPERGARLFVSVKPYPVLMLLMIY